jgi:hypothetical protein
MVYFFVACAAGRIISEFVVTNLPPPFCILRRFVDIFTKLLQLIPELLGSGGQPCCNSFSIFLALVVSAIELFEKDFDVGAQRSRFVTSFPFERFRRGIRFALRRYRLPGAHS